jgi:hypothetical protein
LKASYVVTPRVTTPIIDAGETAEIEIYIAGYGPIERNKLSITFYSKGLGDSENPGTILPSIGLATKRDTGESFVISGKPYVDYFLKEQGERKVDQYGVSVTINPGYFQDTTGTNRLDKFGFPTIHSEKLADGFPPLLLKLNTSRRAERGDYDVDITFTYSDGTDLATDHKRVTIHVTDWNEKHGRTLGIIGLAGTFATIIGLLIAYLQYASQIAAQTLPPD